MLSGGDTHAPPGSARDRVSRPGATYPISAKVSIIAFGATKFTTQTLYHYQYDPMLSGGDTRLEVHVNLRTATLQKCAVVPRRARI